MKDEIKAFYDQKEEIQSKVISWYNTENKRRFLWRKFIFSREDTVTINNKKINRNYALFIVEFLLIRTKAEQVEPTYVAFLKKFDSFEEIVNTDIGELKSFLNNLGLHRRADQLKVIAKAFKDHKLPETLPDLLDIKGVGHYTASAFSCFANKQKVPLVDSNFVRIYCRLFGIREDVELRRNKNFIQFCEKLLPDNNFREFNLGIIDLGADICNSSPRCQICPIRRFCQYYGFVKLLEHDLKYIIIPFYDQSGMKSILSAIGKQMLKKEGMYVLCQIQSLGKQARKRILKVLQKLSDNFPSRFFLQEDSEDSSQIPPSLMVNHKLFRLKEQEINCVNISNWTLITCNALKREFIQFFKLIVENRNLVS